jgi:hypothetical protein
MNLLMLDCRRLTIPILKMLMVWRELYQAEEQ